MPQPILFVGHAVVAGRVRFERLREERELRGADRRFAGFRLAERAVDADEVAEVEQFGDLPAVVADLLRAEHHLDFAGLIPEVEEVDFPHLATTDDAARRTHFRPRVRIVERLARSFANTRNALMAIEPLAPRVDAEGFEFAEFRQAGFSVIGRFNRRVRRRHVDSPFAKVSVCVTYKIRDCPQNDFRFGKYAETTIPITEADLKDSPGFT